MRTFQDNKDRKWEVELNVDVLKRVRGALDVDLLAAIEGELLDRLASDSVLLCDVIYVVCAPQAEAAGITDEDFGRAMAGDAIDDATTALLEELADFFPRPRREVLRKALKKIRKLERMAMKAAAKLLDGPKLEDEMKAEIEAGMNDSTPPSAGGSSTGSRGKSGSSPDH